MTKERTCKTCYAQVPAVRRVFAALPAILILKDRQGISREAVYANARHSTAHPRCHPWGSTWKERVIPYHDEGCRVRNDQRGYDRLVSQHAGSDMTVIRRSRFLGGQTRTQVRSARSATDSALIQQQIRSSPKTYILGRISVAWDTMEQPSFSLGWYICRYGGVRIGVYLAMT